MAGALVNSVFDFSDTIYSELSKQGWFGYLSRSIRNHLIFYPHTASNVNLFLSPVNIYMSLMMLLAGSKDETQQEFCKGLNITKTHCSREALSGFGSYLRDLLSSTDGVDLTAANGLFVLHPIEVHESYKSVLRQQFGATIQDVGPRVPFSIQLLFSQQLARLSCNKARVKHLNQWVSFQTGGHIKELLQESSINDDSRLAIISAIYFAGQWKTQFQTDTTKEADFHLLNEETKSISMMHLKAELPAEYLQDLDAYQVRIPFKGDQWELLIILPRKLGALPQLLSKLHEVGRLQKTLSEPINEIDIDFALPRFTLAETEALDIKTVLQSLGVQRVFDSLTANLTGISDEAGLHVSDIKHKAVLEVNEQGAKAAAAAAVVITVKSAKPVIHANHPFFTAIVHKQTRLPVFLGHVVDPSRL